MCCNVDASVGLYNHYVPLDSFVGISVAFSACLMHGTGRG
jgi:hypothetical protein